MCRMGHLHGHRLGRTHVTEDDYHTGGLAFAVMDGGDGIFDRNFTSVALNEETVRRQVHNAVLPDGHLHWIRCGLTAGGVQDAENFSHGPACRFVPRPARHSYRNEIEEGDISRDVRANNSVADGVERDLREFLFQEQLFLHAFALDGVAQGSKKTARIDLALDEIVLDASLKSLCRHG